ncbi:MAG: ribosomal RNA small subunit methyltransferase A [Clostridia bacterium]|nr:ribosomal RNA small subunit methyltransferase A [Clostridia bacterium]
MSTLNELKGYNFNFNKKFGQNFIFDKNLLLSIVNSANLTSDDEILEIGTGAGTLTEVLASTTKKVVSYEIDNNLREYLTDKFANFDNVTLHFQDVMSVETKKIEQEFDKNYHMVANLPYYITTPIIFKFLEEAEKISSLTIMVQKEVADRLTAKEGTADYGAITASIGTIADAKTIKKISRKMFTPSPNVDSAIVQISINRSKFNIADIATLRKVIKAAFAMRRKTLMNNLKSNFAMSSEEISQLLQKVGISATERGENLSPAKFVELANEIYISSK